MQAAVTAGHWNHFKILDGNNCVSHRERIPGMNPQHPQPLELLDSGMSVNMRLLILDVNGHKS